MKKLLSLVLCGALMLTLVPFASAAVTSSPNPDGSVPESLKILCIGNSFGVDTMEHLANVAKSMGVKDIKLGTLYIGGCSINKHYNNAVNNTAGYEYFVNTGSGWTSTYNHAIRATLQSEDWDYVSIQHGTGDGSRYADTASYTNLTNLANYIRSYVSSDTKIAFNMTWVGEKGSHEELLNVFDNDTAAYYQAICALTRDHILTNSAIDIVSPTGTAIQNARTAEIGLLTRDNYHLSLLAGRYTAALTFFKALTGADISHIAWCPANMSAYTKAAAIEAAVNAHATPFAVTESVLEVPKFSWPTNATYGDAATPQHPILYHAAKVAPLVSHKVDLIGYFNHNGLDRPVFTATNQTAGSLGIDIDLDVTPYLYFSAVVQPGADFTFSLYSNSNYSPWLTFFDASKDGAELSESGETWDALFENGRAQYAKTSVTGCIDMRKYATSERRWILNSMKLYGAKDGSETVLSYFFFGDEGENVEFAGDGDSLLPTNVSDVAIADGKVDSVINADGSLTIARATDSTLAWPSVRITCEKTVDLQQTPYLHLNMTPGIGAANGHLNFSYPDGSTGRIQLSMLVKDSNVDFTAPLDCYVNLADKLGTTGVITLHNYTLSVYGTVGADVTWNAFELMSLSVIPGDVNDDGAVSTKDATAIFRHILGKTKLTDNALKAADYDRDGEVSSSDVRQMLKDIVNE